LPAEIQLAKTFPNDFPTLANKTTTSTRSKTTSFLNRMNASVTGSKKLTRVLSLLDEFNNLGNEIWFN